MYSKAKSDLMRKVAACALAAVAVMAFVVHPALMVIAAAAILAAWACGRKRRRSGYALSCAAPCGKHAPSKSEVMRSWVILF
jgi:hypothetical protein